MMNLNAKSGARGPATPHQPSITPHQDECIPTEANTFRAFRAFSTTRYFEHPRRNPFQSRNDTTSGPEDVLRLEFLAKEFQAVRAGAAPDVERLNQAQHKNNKTLRRLHRLERKIQRQNSWETGQEQKRRRLMQRQTQRKHTSA
ncbi:MAG: hypothetical protein Q9218_002257 [Villophora microphyllina]